MHYNNHTVRRQTEQLHAAVTLRACTREVFGLNLSYDFDYRDFLIVFLISDRLYGIVVRVPGYRSRDPGFDSRRY
jgi:hypothetical protein